MECAHDWPGTLAASDKEGWLKKKISDGHAGEKPNQSGAGEVKFGEVNGEHKFITVIEPMHDHTLAVYAKPIAKGKNGPNM